MHPSPDTAALTYLRAHNALPKLQTPVNVLFGCPRHAAVLRQRRDAKEARLPGFPFNLLSLNR